MCGASNNSLFHVQFCSFENLNARVQQLSILRKVTNLSYFLVLCMQVFMPKMSCAIKMFALSYENQLHVLHCMRVMPFLTISNPCVLSKCALLACFLGFGHLYFSVRTE